MEQFTIINKGGVTAIDAMILSFGQLLQPAGANQIYDFAENTEVTDSLTFVEFKDRFRRLERDGYFWRAGDDEYIVTPKGELLALRSLEAKKRDKLRLLILNKQRYKQ